MMIVVIHGVTGHDNHSAVVGAVEAESTLLVKQALQRFIRTHGGKPQLSRGLFNQFAREQNLSIAPISTVDYDAA